ncbi:uncharacterized protein BDR25DRAFT_312928 [Lindgomyces ingoldianus]|uniref:Uncharacterized protein n=1 Tax=Lindgomyces ingoldianus TaxID=673940 RepID=A0ACB6QZG2_9PLEO|nr:uncharacterized protein BDR25DRAFT_312928 [Lindgomyces ingoldianus]KAF2472378.1 hypothetical protein BDR25DRAFT_312928 [Lindgomyces ingoldianus]
METNSGYINKFFLGTLLIDQINLESNPPAYSTRARAQGPSEKPKEPAGGDKQKLARSPTKSKPPPKKAVKATKKSAPPALAYNELPLLLRSLPLTFILSQPASAPAAARESSPPEQVMEFDVAVQYLIRVNGDKADSYPLYFELHGESSLYNWQ